MTKEAKRKAIIEILQMCDKYNYALQSDIEEFADEIMALPIDVPSEEEIEDFAQKTTHGNTVGGAKWAIAEIKKRNGL